MTWQFFLFYIYFAIGVLGALAIMALDDGHMNEKLFLAIVFAWPAFLLKIVYLLARIILREVVEFWRGGAA